MKDYINRSCLRYYAFILLVLVLSLLIASTADNFIAIDLLENNQTLMLDYFYTNQIIVFIFNAVAFIYFLKSSYVSIQEPTVLSYILSGKESEAEIRKYLFYRALIPYLITTMMVSFVYVGCFKSLLPYFPGISFGLTQLIILTTMVVVSIIVMTLYFKTQRPLLISNTSNAFFYLFMFFSPGYYSIISKFKNPHGSVIVFSVFLVFMVAMIVLYIFEIKSNKKIDIC